MIRKFLLLFSKFVFVYIFFISILVYLQFSKREIEFLYQVKDISLKTYSKYKKEIKSSIVYAILGIESLNFIFGKDKIVSLDGQLLSIKSFEKLSNGFKINFSKNVSFILINKQKNVYFIQINLPKSSNKISFQYKNNIKYNVKLRDNFPGLLISSKKDVYLLTLPQKSNIDLDNKTIQIDSFNKGKIVIGLSIYDPSKNTYENLKGEILNYSSDYDSILNKYTDNSYYGFKTKRFSEGEWLNPYTKEKYFSDDILLALLSHSILKKEFINVANHMRATYIHKKLSYKSGVFLGDLKSTLSFKFEKPKDITDDIKNDNFSSIFEHTNLKKALVVYPYPVYKKLLNYFKNKNLKGLALDEKILFLSNIILQKNDFIKNDLNDVSYDYNAFLQEIFENIVKTENRYFIKKSEGVVDSKLSLLAGLILLEDKDEDIKTLGKALIKSVLSMSDNVGFIPKDIEYFENKTLSQSNYIKPEDIYFLLTKNPYYPHYSFFEFKGNILYSYSIEHVKIRKNKNNIIFSFKNIPNTLNYIYVFNPGYIDNYKGLTLFGRLWRSDSSFEQYSKGRYYSNRHDTLLIKFMSKNKNEKFVIHK